MNNFVRVMKQEVVPVDQQLNTILQQQIAKNRTIMASDSISFIHILVRGWN